jgi:CubicO group peptidase (beta-lactamase class C family)
MALTKSVREAVAEAIAGGELGIAASAYHRGRPVADEWGGTADRERGLPVQRDTLFLGFAHAKVLTAVALHLQVERGLVDLEAPVARYWPAFADNGKAAITVTEILAHEAGLPQMPAGVTPELQCDWDWMVQALAAERPLYPPGTEGAYMIINQGWILGEVVRLTDPGRRDFARFVDEEICAPLGIRDLWLGRPAEAAPRVARLYRDGERSSPQLPPPYADLAQPPAVAVGPEVYNRRDVQEACLPGTGAIGTTRAYARLMAMIAGGGEMDGVRLLSEESAGRFIVPRTHSYESDGSLPYLPPVGQYGLWVGGTPEIGLSPSIAFMPGVGGIVWADLATGLGGAIHHNLLPGAPKPGPHPFAAIGAAIQAIATHEDVP